MRIPRVVIAAPGSGHGKTSVTTGLLGALRQRDLAAERYGLYVLDEFTYPMKWGWIDVGEVVATLGARPGYQHVVVTGRDAHPDLIAAADLVGEMTKVKHPMDAGKKGQRGIEW